MTEETPGPAARPAAFAGDAFGGLHVAVTGGGTGIGAATAAVFAQAGAAVCLFARRREPLSAQARVLAGQGARVHWACCDVTDPQAVEAAFAEAAGHFGPIDVLVNNAGAARSAPLRKTTPALLAETLAVNLNQVFYCTQAVLPAMLERGFGRIVNIASTAGITGYPYVTAYCAAKHGVVGLTRALAMEVARSGVTVNAVCPGYTDTDLVSSAVDTIHAATGHDKEAVRETFARANPLGRMVEPREVAMTAAWLALPASAAMTGQAVAVAGGEVMP